MIEISIAMQKSVPRPKAERRDEAIDGLANRTTTPLQALKASRRRYSQILTARFKDFELLKIAQNTSESAFISNALQNLAEDQIRQS